MFSNYQQAIDWLFSRFPSYQNIGAAAYKPDLGNIQQLLDVLNHPGRNLKFIHVAGTNGKGTTSSIISSYLTESEHQVGLFTSPHLLDFRERIRINGEMISEGEVIEFCTNIEEIKDIEPSFFEISFAMALFHFAKNQCDYCVIEVGMGGRLDATNCITPLVSVITTIGLDHIQFLGDTRTKIAGEKAGIIKQTIPVIIGEKDSETQIVFEEKASNMNSEILFIDDLPVPLWIEKLPFPFNQGFQKQNAFTAFCTIQKLMDVSEHTFFSAIHHLNKNTGYQKRLEQVSENPRIILDVSHNLEGIKATLNLIENSLTGKLYIVYGSSSDKDYRSILDVFPHTTHVCLTPFQSERSWKKSEMETQKKEHSYLEIEIFSNVNDAILTCKEQASEKDSILVFGSFFLIQDISISFP